MCRSHVIVNVLVSIPQWSIWLFRHCGGSSPIPLYKHAWWSINIIYFLLDTKQYCTCVDHLSMCFCNLEEDISTPEWLPVRIKRKLLEKLLRKLYLLHIRALILLFNIKNRLIHIFVINTTLLTLYSVCIWNRIQVTCVLQNLGL